MKKLGTILFISLISATILIWGFIFVRSLYSLTHQSFNETSNLHCADNKAIQINWSVKYKASLILNDAERLKLKDDLNTFIKSRLTALTNNCTSEQINKLGMNRVREIMVMDKLIKALKADVTFNYLSFDGVTKYIN